MTINEFNAWLEGYEASFDKVDGQATPGAEQWIVIKAKLAKVSAALKAPLYRQAQIAGFGII